MGRIGIWSDDNYRWWPSRRRMKADKLCEAILAASCTLLTEVGPRVFTVKEAAYRANVGRTTVYKYYGHKAGLLAACRAAVVRRDSRNLNWSAMIIRRRNRRVQGCLRQNLEAVRLAMLSLIEHLQVESDLFLLAAAEGVRGKRRPAGGLVESPVTPIPQPFFRSVVELLQDAQTAGELKASLDPREVADWLAAMWWQELSIRGPRQDEVGYEHSRLGDCIEKFLAALSAA